MSLVIEDSRTLLRDKLAILGGVAVAMSLVSAGVSQVGLRWPNDITIAEKKVAGILCESIAMGSRWAGIIGIGVNVSTPVASFSGAVRDRATSLAVHLKKPIAETSLANDILRHVSVLLSEIARQDLGALIARARGFDSLLGKSIEARDGDRMVTGTGDGLGDGGQLVLKTGDGRVELTAATLLAVAGQRLRS